MATQVQLRRGTEGEHKGFVGAEGEITIDTTNDTIRVHDGIKDGGFIVPVISKTLGEKNEEFIYPKVRINSFGIVTGGSKLEMSDMPVELGNTYVSKGNVNSGTFTKVKVTKDGIVESGESLTADDIPVLQKNKISGLQASLDEKAQVLSLRPVENVSQSLTLTEGQVNAIKVEASTALILPVVTSATENRLNQLLVQLDNTIGTTVTLSGLKGTFGGGGDTGITIREAGNYNIYLEYNHNMNGWIGGVVKV